MIISQKHRSTGAPGGAGAPPGQSLGGHPLFHDRLSKTQVDRGSWGAGAPPVSLWGATPYFIIVSHQGSTRDGGPPLLSVLCRQGRPLPPAWAEDQGRGASPCFTALPGEPDVEAAGRCHYPGAVSTVAAGAGPYLRPGAVSPLFHRLPAPVPSDRTRSPPHDVPVQNTRCSGLG